ncbi:unnamed protein product [Mytilus edulis]|uniref:EF-hand domain-containing protein n=1 Tax=Mytilus edulis TaxID=6550 RepID=A0A8S3V2S0_MYTED|nr:unnamed protein product [Mytilus edulis]
MDFANTYIVPISNQLQESLRRFKMSAAVASNHLEHDIRTLAQTKRIRVTEFFQDFDKLRSGFITDQQFFRCLWQTLGLKLDTEQEAVLRQKYDFLRNGRFNYKAFCEEIDRNFNPHDLTKDPARQRVEAPEFLVEQEQSWNHKEQSTIVPRINSRRFLRVLWSSRCGEIKRIALLVNKYRDPGKPGLLNYLNLHHDIVAITGQIVKQKQLTPTFERSVDYVPLQPTSDPTLNQIFDKIRVAVFKNGIRTKEFFKDHDKLRSGIITENQFICGLALAVGKEAQLSRPEIQKVVEYYRRQDGRVQYKEFCDMMENAFNIPNLDKKPLQEVVRPSRGALARTLKPLTDAEEARMNVVLSEMAEQVRRRRLMMYTYFKDYDRGKAYTRVVTPLQFGRILHFLSLNVTAEDMKLLCKKFEDPASGDVNYPAFVQCVDKEFVGHTLEDADISEKGRTNINAPEKTLQSISNVSFEDLMSRIRHIVLTNRLRVNEFFQDYDPLRSGSISKAQFRRGLGLLGLSKLGIHDLTDGHYNVLIDAYQSPDKEDQVLWTRFLHDVETVFTQPCLEKDPNFQVPPQEIFRVPKPGTVDWEQSTEDHQSIFEATMDRLRQRTNQRRVLTKPVFQDFDLHNNGHVTPEPEMASLEAKFCNDVGFNYLQFLQELEPREQQQFMYEKRLEELRLTNASKKLPELNIAEDLEGVMMKVKTKVSKERIRVLEYMRDYDKLRSGRVQKISFRRALDLCRFELKESEVCILEDKYQSQGYPDFVDYVKFCDDVESIFTFKELEKAPLQEVVQFKPPEEWELNKLEPEAESMFSMCMDRISEKVRKHRMQLYPLFEDYDRVHNGTVSRSQFRRVLNELELASLVNEQEIKLLWHKFDVKIGGKDDVNYIAFCEMIYALAKFEWRKP